MTDKPFEKLVDAFTFQLGTLERAQKLQAVEEMPTDDRQRRFVQQEFQKELSQIGKSIENAGYALLEKVHLLRPDLTVAPIVELISNWSPERIPAARLCAVNLRGATTGAPPPVTPFPPGEFVDPMTGNRVKFGGRIILWSVMKTICDSHVNLSYDDLRRIAWGPDTIISDEAITTALKDLRALLRKQKRDDLAKLVTSSKRVVSRIILK